MRVFHRGFQTWENWWKLIVFECLKTPMKHEARVFEIASQSCIINQEQWKNSHWFWHRTRNINFCYCFSVIDLFRLYILFCQYRSWDDTQEIWSFVLFIRKSAYKHEYALFNEQDKGSNLLSIITWSVLGKQNVQAKKVYW